jgi:hypothetical protein
MSISVSPFRSVIKIGAAPFSGDSDELFCIDSTALSGEARLRKFYKDFANVKIDGKDKR